MTTPSRRLHVIGGAEDKEADRDILRGFLADAGGSEGKILVIPTASSIEIQVVEDYVEVFTALGAAETRSAQPADRREADSEEMARLVDGASGVLMTGGNQAKLTSVIAGTRLADALQQAYRRGVPIAGTSAGASAMASHMVAGGAEGEAPVMGMATLAAGLGLLPGTIVDQHFTQRNRFGRLLSLVALSPSHLGIGVDEDTALVVTDETIGEVRGSGQVVIIDGSTMQTNAYEASEGEPIMVSGALAHLLPAGARFDLVQRTLLPSGIVGLSDRTMVLRVGEGAHSASEGLALA